MRTCAGPIPACPPDQFCYATAAKQDLAGLPQERIEEVAGELPRLEPDGYFQFTDQHRRLLQHLRFEWPAAQHLGMVARGGYPVPAVHFKRPFGDMTVLDIDMAEILELPPPAPGQLDPRLERLYWEMWPALQTFVEHAAIEVPSASRTGDGCEADAAGDQGVFNRSTPLRPSRLTGPRWPPGLKTPRRHIGLPGPCTRKGAPPR
jgi:hypothetical protein